MTLSIKLNATPDLPSSVPVMTAIAPEWTGQSAADLAAELDVSGDVNDAGLWYVVRDDRSTVEIYQASHSSGTRGTISTARRGTAWTVHRRKKTL